MRDKQFSYGILSSSIFHDKTILISLFSLVFVLSMAGHINNKLVTCLFFLVIYIATPPPADLPNNEKFFIFCFLIILFALFAKFMRKFSFILYWFFISVIPSIIFSDSF
jgi:hypothetical protein